MMKNLKAIREKAGMKQKDFAAQFDIGNTAYSSYEVGPGSRRTLAAIHSPRL